MDTPFYLLIAELQIRTIRKHTLVKSIKLKDTNHAMIGWLTASNNSRLNPTQYP